MQTIELIAVAITLVAVYLTARQVIWCWPLGMVSVAIYAVVFYQARLYADTGLQGLYMVLSAYGWWAWLNGDKGDGALEVSRASRRMMWGLAAVGAIAGVGLGATLSRTTDAALPFMDSTLTCFSIVAQWMQTRKHLQAWLVWFAVDVCYVGMFVYKGLYATGALYAVFLYLAAMGYAQWRRSMSTPIAVPSPLPAS